jgi:hypothetical protein
MLLSRAWMREAGYEHRLTMRRNVRCGVQTRPLLPAGVPSRPRIEYLFFQRHLAHRNCVSSLDTPIVNYRLRSFAIFSIALTL